MIMKNTKKVVYTTTWAIAGIIIASVFGAYASGTGDTATQKITSGVKTILQIEDNENDIVLDVNNLIKPVSDYLSTNYPNISIIEAEQDNEKIDVKLSNWEELEFKIDWTFLKSEMDNEDNEQEWDNDNLEEENEDGSDDDNWVEENDEEKEQVETPESEAAETAKLASQATITESQAKITANASYTGTVKKVSLDDEDGTIVYSVEYTDWTDVKVDANTNVVVKTDAAGSDEKDGIENEQDNEKDWDNLEEENEDGTNDGWVKEKNDSTK